MARWIQLPPMWPACRSSSSNAYLVGAPGESWALVDTGPRQKCRPHPPRGRGAVRHWCPAGSDHPDARALRPRGLGRGSSPRGGTCRSTRTPLEMPYLTGRSDYPPFDPTVGGALAFLARAFPHGGYDFGGRVQPLPEDGSVPGMPGWRWIHTPGHTAGHVSLFREADRTLLAGDALSTADLDSWISQVTYERELSRPPTPAATPDWPSARRSVAALVELEPSSIAAGHGVPVSGPDTAGRLRRFAGRFMPPSQRAVRWAAGGGRRNRSRLRPAISARSAARKAGRRGTRGGGRGSASCGSDGRRRGGKRNGRTLPRISAGSVERHEASAKKS